MKANATGKLNIPQEELDKLPMDNDFFKEIREMNGTRINIQIPYFKMHEDCSPKARINFQTISGQPANMIRKYFSDIEKSEELKAIDDELLKFEEEKREANKNF